MPKQYTGRCRCGAVSYTLQGEPFNAGGYATAPTVGARQAQPS